MLRFLLYFLAFAKSVNAFTYETISISGISYHAVIAKPGEIEMAWKSPEGKPLRTFEALKKSLPSTPQFIMNAGIFEPGGIPSGLHVQDGKQLLPLNLKDAPGNFFLKPNGVFLIGASGARVVDSVEYGGLKATPRLALQSGPLLLRDDKIHPKFREGSTSRLHRNGVGVLPDGRILFLMTDQKSASSRVNLHGFASAFLKKGCRDALFLDGDISKMFVAGKFELRSDNHYGALIYIGG